MDHEASAVLPVHPPREVSPVVVPAGTTELEDGARGSEGVPKSEVSIAGWTWQSVLVLTILAGLVVWLYLPVLKHLAWQWWDDENYSHGFLIPLMSAYFVWDRRERLRKLADAPSWLGLPVLVAGVGLFLLGNVAAELFTMRASLLVILAGLVLYLLGREHLKALAFPILYLIFMIPPPTILFNSITFPLQLFAARTATATLQFVNIPVLREGNVIILANTTLEVAEACSGIRSLATLLALATTLAYFTQRRRSWRATALVASAVPVAIVANASRVAGTGILAHYYGAQVAEGFLHTFSGWLLFLVATALLGIIGGLLAKLAPGQGRTQDPTSSVALPGEKEPVPLTPARSHGGLWRVTGAALVLVAGVTALPLLSRGESVPLRRSLDRFPIEVGAWRGISEALPPSELAILRVTDYLNRLYAAPGKAPIWLYVGYYETQRQGQIIHSPQQCLPGSGWNFLSRQYLTLGLPGRASPVTINNVLVGKGEERLIVLYWYQERGRIVANEYKAKLYMITDAVMQNRTDGALVRLSAPVRGSQEQTIQQLLEFARLMFPSLTEFLPN